MHKDEPNNLENMMDMNNHLLQKQKTAVPLAVIKMHSCKEKASVSDI